MGYGNRWIFLLYLNCKILSPSKWRSNWLFLSSKGSKAGRTSLPCPIYFGNGLLSCWPELEKLYRIQGFQVGKNPNTFAIVSHLLYAGTLIFCGADSQQINYLNITKMVFESISDLQINMLISRTLTSKWSSQPRRSDRNFNLQNCFVTHYLLGIPTWS